MRVIKEWLRTATSKQKALIFVGVVLLGWLLIAKLGGWLILIAVVIGIAAFLIRKYGGQVRPRPATTTTTERRGNMPKWVINLILVVVSILIGVGLWFWLGWWLIGIVILVPLAAWAVVFISRSLADQGYFKARVPESSTVIITKDRSAWRFYVAASGKLRTKMVRWCKKKNKQAGCADKEESEQRYQMVGGDQGGLVWVGIPPISRVHERWDNARDEGDPNKALHSVSLKDTTWFYRSAHQGGPIKDDEGKVVQEAREGLSSGYDSNGVPDYESGDPVGVASAMAIYTVVEDPELAVFGVSHREEAIRGICFDAWRVTLSTLLFLEEVEVEAPSIPVASPTGTAEESAQERTAEGLAPDVKAMEFKFRPGILERAPWELRVRLGLAVRRKSEPEGESADDHEKPSKKKDWVTAGGWWYRRRTRNESLPVGSPAHRCQKDWGTRLFEVAITDLEETEGLRATLAMRLKAIFKAISIMEESKGTAAANILLGESMGRKLKAMLAPFMVKGVSVEQAQQNFLAWFQASIIPDMPADGRTMLFPYGMGGTGSTQGLDPGMWNNPIMALPIAMQLAQAFADGQGKGEKSDSKGEKSDSKVKKDEKSTTK